MKKVLFVASVSGHIRAFHLPYLEWFRKEGYQVDVAARLTAELPPEYNFHNISFERSPFKKSNISVYKQLKKLIDENEYDIIHCHTPVAAILTRLAARKARKHGTKVIYTAHGFHFYKGAPLLNWLIYYLIEKLCSKWTDVLITINKEDYEFAKKKMKAKWIKYVPGVGFDYDKFSNFTVTEEKKNKFREDLGIGGNDVMLVSVGELNDNKNHSVIIKALSQISHQNVHYCIAGKGPLENSLKQLSASLGLGDRVHILGFRTDVQFLLNCADIFCFPSKREGLGIAAIEAMACGLPIVTSNIHGINDYSEDGITGFKCSPNDVVGFVRIINKLFLSPELRDQICENNREIAKSYNIDTIMNKVRKIYLEALREQD